MTDPLTAKWLPRELRRETAAIADKSFQPIGRGKGARAKLVQEWLCLAGHSIAVDGDFGPATEQAVRDFRAAKGLNARSVAAAGQVDARTFQALVQPMTDVLQPIANPPVGLGAAVMAYAERHLAQHPVEVGGQNCGPWVRLYMSGNEGKDWPWCAGFVTFLLRQACDTLGRGMPIKGSFSCDTLAAQAKDKDRFVAESKRAAAGLAPGAIFLSRRTATDWTHTGLVSSFAAQTFKTVEGNTNDEGSREGFEVCARTRGYAKRDFIRID